MNFSKRYFTLLLLVTAFFSLNLQAQTAQDSLEIKRVALAYIEAQHTPNPN